MGVYSVPHGDVPGSWFYASLHLWEETVLTPLSRTKRRQSRGCDGQAVRAVVGAMTKGESICGGLVQYTYNVLCLFNL